MMDRFLNSTAIILLVFYAALIIIALIGRDKNGGNHE